MSLRAGKLPADLLGDLLSRLTAGDRVVLGPAIGRDAAAVAVGDRVIVAASDPVTFATQRAGWYAVHVNANDVACLGARPSWFLATILLPEGANDALPAQIFQQIGDACATLNIAVIGGHTEVTAGVDHVIIAGTMLGETSRDELIDGAGVKAGDAVLLTGTIAIEGTALLALEEADALRAAGTAQEVVMRARGFLDDPGISIVSAAAGLRAATQPRLLHDATEGGIATALEELAHAAGMTVHVDLERIAVLPETRMICDALSIDPLGLLSSGALLAVVDGDEAEAAIRAMRNVTISCARLGTVEDGPPRVIMGAERRPLPRYERDELARYFSTREA